VNSFTTTGFDQVAASGAVDSLPDILAGDSLILKSADLNPCHPIKKPDNKSPASVFSTSLICYYLFNLK